MRYWTILAAIGKDGMVWSLMPDDPLTDIEHLRGWFDIGRGAFQMYKGAIDAGAEQTEAMLVVSIWFSTMAESVQLQNDNPDASPE
jgi:hypothetical protein